MRKVATIITVLLLSITTLAQRPSDPALLVPQVAPELNYVAVANPLTLPAGMVTGAASNVAFDANGHLWVLFRGQQPFVEFDGTGKFIRAFGEGLFTRSHGLRFDKDGNIWATDVAGHTVMKLNTQGQVLMTIGTKGQAGQWDESTGSHKLNEPNDVNFSANGDIFIVQGHTPGPVGDSRVLKFDKTGKFIKSWGGKGKGPGQFDVAHSIEIDSKGQLWVADRENQRIQIFDTDGKFLKELKYSGLPCSFQIRSDFIYMSNGYAGQILKLDLEGKVLAATGKPGRGLGEFGEAHDIAVSPTGDIWVADSVKPDVHKFVPRP